MMEERKIKMIELMMMLKKDVWMEIKIYLTITEG